MKRRITLIVLFFALSISNAIAVPAYPGLIVFTQPRSETTVSIYLKGDEKVHWAETEDGYSLLHGDDGSLYYAMRDASGDMVASEFLATEIKLRSNEVNYFLAKTKKHLRFSQRQVDGMLKIWNDIDAAHKGPKQMSNVIGEKKFLVILFAFSDQSFYHNKFKFKSLFNQINYSLNGATGSVHDYYYDVSGGLFSLNVDVVGPFTGTRNAAFYGDNYQAFAKEAVDSAAKYVDFSDYDNDGDGHIDGLHIIFAGHGEEAGATNTIWSHKSYIYNPRTLNGVVVDVYSCSPECSGHWGNTMTAIGVICHELGHVFGAPDYYDTDYAGSGGEYPGLGVWDIMSSGSWNGGGASPAQHNPYTKIYIYKWGTCDTIDGTPQKVIMNPVGVTNYEFHRINTSTPGDFFLLENRQKIKWDKTTPGTGLIVYHIHPSAHGASVSNATHPQQIYILSQTSIMDTFPTATPSSYGTIANAAFPGPTAKRDTLTDYSIPWFRPWSKQPNHTPLYHISENATTKQVTFFVQEGDPMPTNASAEGASMSDIIIDWTPYGGYNTLIIMSPDTAVFGTPSGHYAIGDTVDGGGIVVYKGDAFSCLASNLDSARTYYFKVFSLWRDTNYSKGVVVSAKTLNCASSEWHTEDFESVATGDLPECWNGEWVVDSTLDGNHYLTSCRSCQTAEPRWVSVTTCPFAFDTIRNAVLNFKLNFSDNSTATSKVKIEFSAYPGAEWQTIETIEWRFGMPQWNDLYMLLPAVDSSSRIRFSLLTDCTTRASIDDIAIVPGGLVFANSDNNGNISPRGYIAANEGDTVVFTLSPLPGFKVGDLKLNGASVDPITLIGDSLIKEYKLVVSGYKELYAVFVQTEGIEEAEDIAALQVYPNPTEGRITVENVQGKEITIYNIIGQCVISRKAEDDIMNIDIQDLPNGIYILRCGMCATKIIKK